MKKSFSLTLSALAFAVSGYSSVAFANSKPPPISKNSNSVKVQSDIVTAPVEPVPDALLQQKDFYEKHTAKQLSRSRLSAANAADCSSVYSGYGSKTGQALVDHILNNPSSCIDDLFTGDNVAISAFGADKMYSVANATASLATNYDPTTATEKSIGKLFYFLRAGYYVQFYNSTDIPEYPNWVKTSIRSALDSLFENPKFYTSSDIHGKNIQDAITLVDSAGENARYLYVVKQWLSHWDSTMANSWYMRAAVNEVFTVLFRGHYDNEFVQAATNDSELIQLLGSFATSDWMLNSSSDFMQENAAAELSRFLQYNGSSISGQVTSEVRKILNKYSMNGVGANVWLKAASAVEDYGHCAEFNICGFADQLEDQILGSTHSCSSSMKFRAQDMTSSQLADSCNAVTEQEVFFHHFMVTNQEPVADDHNDSLEMVVFDSSDDYGLYAGLFFGISTDNGGMYLEGNPSDVNNQARFIAYEAEWMRPNFEVWNLTHEMVHYLDGRFNLKGNFADSKTDTHKTVWWIEGLAEYISKQNRNDLAVGLASSKKFNLSEIFGNNYSSGTERVYHWGYLAVRFMFERHPQKVSELLTYFRAGDFNGYLSEINAIGTSYDNEWLSWLDTVQSDDSIPDVTIGNPDGPGQGSNELTNGQTKSGLNAQQNDWLHYYIDVPAGEDKLVVTQEGGTGDGDLYVKFGEQPGVNTYDCRPYISGNEESCEFSSPAAGRWYVSSYSYSGFDNLSLTATLTTGSTQPNACATQAPVSYTQLSPDSQYCVGAASNNDYTYFYLYNTVANARYTFELSGTGQGNADLYFGSNWPTSGNHVQASVNSGSNESITTAPLPVGWVYISVHANGERPDTTLTVTLK